MVIVTPDIIAKIWLSIFNGENAVFLFFVMSGCVLGASLNRTARSGFFRGTGAFLINWVMRLYPALIACMVAFYAAGKILTAIHFHGFPLFNASQLVSNSLLLSYVMHGSSYTLQIEMMAIPFILATFALRQFFGVVGLVFALMWTMCAIQADWMVMWLPNMHPYIVAFIVGMIIAEPGFEKVVANLPTRSGWLALSIFVVFRMFIHHENLASIVAMSMSAEMLVAIIFWHGGVFIFLATIPVAWASEKWIEIPGTKVGRAFGRVLIPPRGKPNKIPESAQVA